MTPRPSLTRPMGLRTCMQGFIGGLRLISISIRKSANNLRSTISAWVQRQLHRSRFVWATLALAMVFYILATVYIVRSDLVCYYSLFGRSPANAIGTANVLSWTANTLLSASIGQSLDTLRMMLIARPNGHGLLSNLALQPGTGIDGLSVIIWNARSLGTYLAGSWSLFRLLSMTIVPALGIVVLIDAPAVPVYFQENTQNITRGYGIGEFNASLAVILQPMTDSLFGTRFKDFLSDQDLVINTSNATDLAGCYSGLVNDSRGPCRAQYAVVGGIEQFAPRLLVGSTFSSGGDIQPVIAKDLTGYYLQFQATNETEFDTKLHCAKHGYGLASFQLCVKDVGQHMMSASIQPCPKSLAVNLRCMSNATWPTDEGWETTFQVDTRPANVVYNGLNGTILDHNFLTDTLTPVNITAHELLMVFSVLFAASNTTSPYGKALSAIGIGNNRPVEPFIIWEYFQGLAELAKMDPRANARAQLGLQSLLTIPIYHCQAKDFAELRRLLLEQIQDSGELVNSLGVDLIEQFPLVDPDTDIFPAILRYKLELGQGSLLIYVILAGTTLALCLGVNILNSCTKRGDKFKDVGPFAMLTQMCECKIVDEKGCEIPCTEMRTFDEACRLERGKLLCIKHV